MNRRTLIKVVIPTFGLSIGLVAVALADQSQTKVSVTTAPTQDPITQSTSSPDPTPKVTVNGRHVDTADGVATTVPVPGGTATVERLGDETSVTAKTGDDTTTTIAGVGDIHVNVSSTKTSGRSRTTSHVTSSSSSESGSGSSMTTSVTTSSNGVTVTH